MPYSEIYRRVSYGSCWFKMKMFSNFYQVEVMRCCIHVYMTVVLKRSFISNIELSTYLWQFSIVIYTIIRVFPITYCYSSGFFQKENSLVILQSLFLSHQGLPVLTVFSSVFYCQGLPLPTEDTLLILWCLVFNKIFRFQQKTLLFFPSLSLFFL